MGEKKMKKFISLLLAIFLLMGSMISVGASRHGHRYHHDEPLPEVTTNRIVYLVLSKMLKTSKQAAFRFSKDMLEILDYNHDHFVSLNELHWFFEDYVVIDLTALDASAERIAGSAEYKVTVLDNGETAVYVFVDLKEHPELFIPGVFAETVQLIDEAQQEIGLDAADDYTALRYSQIAGELVLHEAVYAVTSVFGGMYSFSPLNEYYEAAVEACINIDEDRVPAAVVDIVGIISTLTSLLGDLFIRI